MLSRMEKKKTVQMNVRVNDPLLRQLKYNSKIENLSLNKYVVSVLEKAVEPEWPHIRPEDIKPCPWLDEIRALFPANEGAVVADDFDWKKAKAEYLEKKYCANESEN